MMESLNFLVCRITHRMTSTGPTVALKMVTWAKRVANCHTRTFLESLSIQQVNDVVRLFVEYVKDEVPIENWEGQPPARTVHLLRTLLKNRDKVTTEGIQAYHMVLEKEFRKNQ